MPIRIRAKSILLTYPHCDVSKEHVMDAVWNSCAVWEPIYCVTCEENHADGEPHVHCFVQCANPVQIKRKDMRMFDIVKEKDGVPQTYHCNIKSCKSPKDAINYVKKHGNYVTKGTCTVKGAISTKEKNALLRERSLVELVENGEVSIFKIPQLKKAISILEDELLENTKRLEAPKVRWFYGETGTGKTREAVRIGEETYKGDYWISNQNGQWFDGYEGQKLVIIDDIRANTWDFSQILRITDRYAFRVPVKGSFKRWLPDEIIITAPGRPEDIYSNHATGESFDGIEQLQRRITEIREFE